MLEFVVCRLVIVLGLVVVVVVVEHGEEELLKLLGSCDFEGTMVKPAAKSTKQYKENKKNRCCIQTKQKTQNMLKQMNKF